MNRTSRSILALLFIPFLGCNSQTDNSAVREPKKAIDIPKFSAEHQVLLTNEAEFKAHSGLSGASAFLVRYNNEIYAVTARHLLGEAGGVEPEIRPEELSKYLDYWIMYPRVANKLSNDSVSIAAASYKELEANTDLLLLKTEAYQGNLYALEPGFSKLSEGEQLFILGCPYAEEDCRQNVYPIKFMGHDQASGLMACRLEDRLELSGFSGAPVLNASGQVVGILSASWEENGHQYAGVTSIEAIRKIKF